MFRMEYTGRSRCRRLDERSTSRSDGRSVNNGSALGVQPEEPRAPCFESGDHIESEASVTTNRFEHISLQVVGPFQAECRGFETRLPLQTPCHAKRDTQLLKPACSKVALWLLQHSASIAGASVSLRVGQIRPFRALSPTRSPRACIHNSCLSWQRLRTATRRGR